MAAQDRFYCIALQTENTINMHILATFSTVWTKVLLSTLQPLEHLHKKVQKQSVDLYISTLINVLNRGGGGVVLIRMSKEQEF